MTPLKYVPHKEFQRVRDLKVDPLTRTALFATLSRINTLYMIKRAGSGHVYQGRFKSFPVQEDEYFYIVCRYVERNALRAGLVRRAEKWPWSSLHRWKYGSTQEKRLLSAWPLPRRRGWLDYVNTTQSEAELAALRLSVKRGCPYGDESWMNKIVGRLGLESTLRPPGRPKKRKNGS